MKTLVSLLTACLLSLTACSVEPSKGDITGTDPTDNILAIVIPPYVYSPDECRSYNPLVNGAYYTKERYFRIKETKGFFPVAVTGDSTMDWPKHYPGFFSETTFNFASTSNTSCDMLTQFHNVHIDAPEVVVIGSAGVVNLVDDFKIPESVTTMNKFIDRIRDRWPTTRIVVNAIHPTAKPKLNENKPSMNFGVREHLLSLPNTCFVDSNSIFGLADGEEAYTGLVMRDGIHLTEDNSFVLKAAILNQCGVSL
jgi:hypothetical protein